VNREPFLLVALIALCTAYFAAVVAFGIYFGALRAAGVFVAGFAFAAVVATFSAD
jgi:hypothetical protein